MLKREGKKKDRSQKPIYEEHFFPIRFFIIFIYRLSSANSDDYTIVLSFGDFCFLLCPKQIYCLMLLSERFR